MINTGSKMLTVAQNSVEICNSINEERLEVSGSPIVIDGVSGLEHKLDVKLSSRNLFPSEALDKSKWIKEGNYYFFYFELLPGEYVISAKNHQGTDSYGYGYYRVQTKAIGESLWTTYPLCTDTIIFGPVQFTVEEGMNVRFFWWGGNDKTPWNIFYDVQIEKGSTATDYVPPYVEDTSDIAVIRYGKNLLPSEVLDESSWYVHEDGTHKCFDLDLPPSNYVISNRIKNVQSDGYYGYYRIDISSDDFVTYGKREISSANYYTPKTEVAFKIENGQKARLSWYGKNDKTPFITYFADPQIELGSTATAYEPYVEPVTYTSNSDGVVSGITSLSPSMTLMSNSKSVIINCKYFSSGSDLLRSAAANCLQKLKDLRKNLGEYLKHL